MATDTTASGPSSIVRNTAAVYSVRTTAGDRVVPGKLVIKVTKNNGNYSKTKTIFAYDGSASVVTPVLKTKGRYTVKFRYIPRASSVYRARTRPASCSSPSADPARSFTHEVLTASAVRDLVLSHANPSGVCRCVVIRTR